MPKTLNVTDNEDLKSRVEDVEIYGGVEWVLLCKASSESQGWMKSTKAMLIDETGCLVQVTTQQKNPDGSYSLAEAVTFVPGVEIGQCADGTPCLFAMDNMGNADDEDDEDEDDEDEDDEDDDDK